MQYITDFADLDLSGTYSYADYLLWRFEERVEIIKGKVFIANQKWFLKNIFKKSVFLH